MADISSSCKLVFAKLHTLSNLRAVHKSAPPLFASLDDVSSRFQIWSNNIGASQTSRESTSLEHRVRAAPKLRKLFLDRLRDLQEDLDDLEITLGEISDQALQSVPYVIPTSSASGTLSDDEPDPILDIAKLLEAVHEDITSLYKLSIAARKTTTRDRYITALARVEPSHVLDEDAEADAIGDQYRRLRSPALQWLRLRLATANNVRRRFLKYCESHQAHILAANISLGPEEGLGNLRSAMICSSTVPEGSTGEDDIKSTAGKTSASTVDASEFDRVHPVLDRFDQDETESQASYISYATESAADAILTVCDLETVQEGQETFVCPYCKEEQTIKSQHAWRRHVYKDLRSYVCTSESCGLRMFESSHAWLNHELSEHFAVQQCPYCEYQGCNSAKGDVETHMTAMHASRFRDGQLQDLTKALVREPDKIPSKACPFCDWETKLRYADNQAPSNGDIYVSSQRYRRHVGSHLEQVALAVIEAKPKIGDSDTDSLGDRAGEDEASFKPVDLQQEESLHGAIGDDPTYPTVSGIEVPNANLPVVESRFTILEKYAYEPSVVHTEYERFLREVEQLKQSYSQDSKLASIDVRSDQHSWDDVLRTVEAAENQYNARGNGTKARMGHLIKQMDPFMKLLPGSDYSSLIWGGVRVLIEVGTRRERLQEDISVILKDVPSVLEQARALQLAHADDEDFQHLTVDLWIAVLRAFTAIMKWHNQSTSRKLWNALQPGSHDKVLALEAANVQNCAERLRRDASLLEIMASRATSQEFPSVDSPSVELRTGESHPSDLYIVVMGGSGSGKSRFISLCTDDIVPIGHGLESTTMDVAMYRCNIDLGLSGCNVWLIDTPSFSDIQQSDGEVLKVLALFFAEAFRLRWQMSGILYLYRIHDSRLVGSNMDTMKMMCLMAGTEAFQSAVIVTTFWDTAKATLAEHREAEVRKLWTEYCGNGSQIERHDDSVESARKTLKGVALRDNRIILDIQRELVEQNLSLDKTAAGREVSRGMAKVKEDMETKVMDLREHMDKALRAQDRVMQISLERERKILEDKIESLEEERRLMKEEWGNGVNKWRSL